MSPERRRSMRWRHMTVGRARHGRIVDDGPICREGRLHHQSEPIWRHHVAPDGLLENALESFDLLIDLDDFDLLPDAPKSLLQLELPADQVGREQIALEGCNLANIGPRDAPRRAGRVHEPNLV